jgi:hypothetical protein
MDCRVKDLGRGAVLVVLVLERRKVWIGGLMDRGVVRGVDLPRMGYRMLGLLSCRMLVGGWRYNVDG